MRYGSFNVETSNQPFLTAFAAMNLPQSEMRPSINLTSAPNARHSTIFAEGVSAGIAITHPSPAFAAYAAAAPPALPAVGRATVAAPSAFAMVTAAERPRALNDAVGFSPSSFMWKWRSPRRSPRRLAWINGVIPSPSVIAGSPGSTSSYRHIVCGRVRSASILKVRSAAARSYRASSGDLQTGHRFWSDVCAITFAHDSREH